jgi:hypothetical protein
MLHIDGVETPKSDVHGATGCWNITLFFSVQDELSTFLWSISEILPDHKSLDHRKQSSSTTVFIFHLLKYDLHIMLFQTQAK